MSKTAAQRAAELVTSVATPSDLQRAEIQAGIEALVKESDARVQATNYGSTERMRLVGLESTAGITSHETTKMNKKGDATKS